MLNFDPWAELEKIRSEKTPPAASAASAANSPNAANAANAARGVVSGKTSKPPIVASGALTGPKLIYTSDDDTLAFAAIQNDCRTYGAVAMTTRMGATRAFQATERLKEAGRIQQAKDGTLTPVEGSL